MEKIRALTNEEKTIAKLLGKSDAEFLAALVGAEEIKKNEKAAKEKLALNVANVKKQLYDSIRRIVRNASKDVQKELGPFLTVSVNTGWGTETLERCRKTATKRAAEAE